MKGTLVRDPVQGFIYLADVITLKKLFFDNILKTQ